MAESKKRILILVEGVKTDVRLMRQLLDVYGLDEKYEIISYKTNIYTLYDAMFKNADPDTMDLQQTLKEHERDPIQRMLLDAQYTDILLVFDFDPQDARYSAERLQEMQRYFEESSDTGKLYINYPMVESFYHMQSIPDPEYFNRAVTMQELFERTYKRRVNLESKGGDYAKYAVTHSDWSTVIKQNIDKAHHLLGTSTLALPPDTESVLQYEIRLLEAERMVQVLCTCVFYIAEYNTKLLEDARSC